MRRVIHIGEAVADELRRRAGSRFWDEDRMTVEVVETQDGELFLAGYVKKSKAQDRSASPTRATTLDHLGGAVIPIRPPATEEALLPQIRRRP